MSVCKLDQKVVIIGLTGFSVTPKVWMRQLLLVTFLTSNSVMQHKYQTTLSGHGVKERLSAPHILLG